MDGGRWPSAIRVERRKKNQYATRMFRRLYRKSFDQMRIMGCVSLHSSQKPSATRLGSISLSSSRPRSRNGIIVKIETTFSTITLLLWIIRVNIIRLSLTPSSTIIMCCAVLLHACRTYTIYDSTPTTVNFIENSILRNNGFVLSRSSVVQFTSESEYIHAFRLIAISPLCVAWPHITSSSSSSVAAVRVCVCA